MQLFYESSLRRGSKTRLSCGILVALVAGFFVDALPGPVCWGQIVQPQQVLPDRGRPADLGDRDAVSGVYLPTDRALSKAVGRAKERIAGHEFHEALPFLQNLLTRNEDSFLERTPTEREQLGLKATARQIIGELPPEGYDAYELLNGPTARRQLEAALKAGDRNGVANVVRQYFHTAAGYEATFLLAEMEADLGHRLAAAELFRDLIDTPRAAARFEPQLSVAAAVNCLTAGQRDAAAKLIRKLVERQPGGQVVLRGKNISLPAASADPLAWLADVVGEVKTVANSDGDWLTLRGDATRNVQSEGGEPHLRPRWEARVVNEPTIEAFLSNRAADFVQRNIVKIPAARPIAVGNMVIMRTAENVVAVDWQTGKRMWETRDEQELDTEEIPADLAPASDHDLLATQSRPIEERTWDDSLATSLASDGKRIFLVRGMQPAREDFASPFQVNAMFGRIGGVENMSISNQLSAYDIATQGKLVWELDGGRATGPLAGAFFLGPPLAVDGMLYAMAEIRGSVYLLAIDPATGRLDWQQQLVGLEQGIALDPARRRAGATPSYSGGILVCPTAASAAIGIDLVRREFAWVYRYPREFPTPMEGRNIWQQQQMQGQIVRPNDQWLDNSAVIVDNRVLLTPPESSEMYCLDLRSGKLLWKHRQGDALFVGGVDQGIVLLVGVQNVQAVRLNDGAVAWKKESVPLPTGALPAGQGYVSQGRYFLPLSTGQIAEVEIATGSVKNEFRPNSDILLGNLICYRGSVISQSPLMLDKFEQLDALQKRNEAALAKNPNDASALRELAEIKSAAGDKAESIRMLKRAHEIAPDDVSTQQMLAENLLAALAKDYATYRGDVPLVSKLIHTREEQIELLRIDAAGHDTADNRVAAWDAYLRLADFLAEEPAYLNIGDDYTVRSDRWVASHLGAIWSVASAQEQRTLKRKVAARMPTLENLRTSAETRHFLAHLGELPEAADVRLMLAKFLISQKRPQEAEIELLQLAVGKDDASKTAATELLAKLATRADRPLDALKSGWPKGQVKVELVSNKAAEPPQDRTRSPHFMLERQNGYRQLRVEQDILPRISSIQWFVALDVPEIIARDAFGNDVARWTLDQNRFIGQRETNVAHGARLGHLLFFTLGNQVMAIDSRQEGANADSELLWPSRSPDDFSLSSIRVRRALAASQRTSRPVVYHAYSNRKRIMGAAANMGGALGPATPSGVVVQEQDELKCVAPLTGVMLWTRSDIPAGCELFGDGELAFAADVGNHVAYVLRLSDGQLLGKRDIPAAEWLTTSGRQIAQISFNSGRKKAQVTITDIWSQKTIYQGEFSAMARFSVVEPNYVAVVEPSGAFHLIDVADGRMMIDDKVDVGTDLQSLQTLRCGDDLYLFVSGPVQGKNIGPPLDYPIVNGSVYAFDLKSGKALWPSPAVVRNRGVMLQQPSEIPVLVFADRQLIRDSATGGGSKLRLLCLDRRTGQTLYRNDALPDTSSNRFRIRGKTEPAPAVALEMSAGKIVLALSDTPRPPQPVANDDLETPREKKEHGLRAVGQKFGEAMGKALEGSAPNAGQGPPRPEVPNNVPSVSKKKGPGDFDDD